jgi:hypothetical protein
MKNKGGRPQKLTPLIKAAIIDGIEKGLSLKAICKCAGISYSSLANWKKLAKAKDHKANLYTDLIASMNIAIELAWHQYREKALSSINSHDFKSQKTQQMRLTRQEKQEINTNDAIAKLNERFDKLKERHLNDQ